MRFKELSEENIEYLRFVYFEDMGHEEKMEILSKKFQASKRTIRRWWKEELRLSEYNSSLPEQLKVAEKRELNKGTNVLLVTAAQNKTGVNTKFIENLKAYATYLEKDLGKKVEIVIAPTTYRNPTSPSETGGQKTEQWWVDEVIPYLHYGKLQFGDTIIATNTRVRPTAKQPLTSFEVLAKDNNLIIPHPKVHFKTLPRFRERPLRTMSTTGYITHKNYSSSKAGDVAEQHHSYSFVVVEKKKDNICHIPRNVKVKSDGSFIDIVFNVEDGKVNKINESEALVWGDLHASEVNDEIFDKTIKLHELLNPKKAIIHDAIDFSSANPHEVKDMYILKKKIREGKNLIEDEIEHCFDLLSLIKDTGTDVNVVVSNHDIFLDRLINDKNWKSDLYNSHSYLKYAYLQQTINIEDYGGIFGYLLTERFKGEIKYINYGESLPIMGYECGSHNDFGSNGSRASYKQSATYNMKQIGGHSHSPIIYDSYTGVGVTCNLHQYYNRRGISSWAYAHSVVHGNGKNQLLVFGDDMLISSLI
jgi:hypothetical protein